MPRNCQKYILLKTVNSARHSSNSFSSVLQRTLQRMFNLKKYTTYRSVPQKIQSPPYILSGNDVSPVSADVKTKLQIEEMRPACELAASILRHVGANIEAGMTTDDIDAMVHRKSIEAGAYPSPLQYKGFPKSVCTSVNHIACHGVPGSLVLQDGDIINVDITVFFQGYHGDTSETFMIGDVDRQGQLLVQAAKDCRDIGISVCREGALFSDIGEVVYMKAQEAGFEVIPNFCGHGIGQYFHGPPDIVHVPSYSGARGEMKAGMTFTVEPIICEGSPEIQILSDDWTVVTKDKSRSAQFEHTILVTKNGHEILTK
ncbi:methionine aminopeptidase 1D, mitochondrial isoform X2 [Aplysia californica]|nr:methionine aminopeptidase 1D, mitochondrial isoform X2 [Aplysia californica]